MSDLPFKIPQSLASYMEHFQDDPSRATTRLKKQLRKRGADAVGHFLLAWFYHLKGLEEQSVEEALKAKVFAPGSPFFKNLHYYLSHPKTFDAWIPSDTSHINKQISSSVNTVPVLNLDSLIQKLSEVEPAHIHHHKKKDKKNDKLSTFSTHEENVDDIVSETLAGIHEKQGNTDAAIHTYERLKEVNKGKKDYYKSQILRLKKGKDTSKGK